MHGIWKLLHFTLLHYVVEKLLHFALKILLYFASMLLQFAATLITFCDSITICDLTVGSKFSPKNLIE